MVNGAAVGPQLPSMALSLIRRAVTGRSFFFVFLME
jgi:hypothetical protein